MQLTTHLFSLVFGKVFPILMLFKRSEEVSWAHLSLNGLKSGLPELPEFLECSYFMRILEEIGVLINQQNELQGLNCLSI